MKIEDFIQERIEENKHLFTQEELRVIRENFVLIRKIYELGLMNGNTKKN